MSVIDQIRHFRPNLHQAAILLLASPILIHSTTLYNYIPMYAYNLNRYASLIVLAMLGILALFNQRKIMIPTPRLMIVALICLGIAASELVNHGNTLPGEALYLIICLLGWLILSGIKKEHGSEQDLMLFAYVLAASALLYSVNAMATILPHCLFDQDCLYYNTAPLGFENRRIYNEMQALMIPALAYLALRASNNRIVVLLVGILSVQLGHLYITGGRAAMLGSFGALLAMTYLERHHWRKLSIILAPALLISLAMYLGLKYLDQQPITDLNIRTSSSGRWELWQIAWQGGLNSPWLGNGPGSFALLGLSVGSPHNFWMTVWHDLGILFALLMLALTGVALHRVYLTKNSLLTALGLGLLSSYLFGGHFTSLSVLASLILLSQLARPNQTKMLSWVFSVGLLLSITIFAWNYQPATENFQLKPRLWLQLPSQ